MTRFRAGVTPAGYPPSKPATPSASKTTLNHYQVYMCIKYAEGIRMILLNPRLWLRGISVVAVLPAATFSCSLRHIIGKPKLSSADNLV